MTVMTMRLQQTEVKDLGPELSISVHAMAVRCGNDGVGMEFLPHTPSFAQNGHTRSDRDTQKSLRQIVRRLE